MQKNKNRFFHALYTLPITSSFRLISNPFAHLKILKPKEGMIKNFNGTFGFLALFY